MSTAVVSHVFDYDFTDAIYKVSNAFSLQTHHKSISFDRKSLGLSTTAPRRNSTSATTPPSTPSPKAITGKIAPPNGVGLQNSILAIQNHQIQQQQQQAMAPREHRRLDRSLSEPVDNRAQVNGSPTDGSSANGNNQLRSTQANSSRYKTELCRPFEENGTCKYGDKCQFAHGGHELRNLARHPKYKTELCRTFHTTGFCPYGPRCHFIHNSEESKKTLLTSLQANMTMPGGNGRDGQQHHQHHNNHHNGHHHHPIRQTTRPKALSIGSFSLGSTGELTPPSSVSDSPTSLNGFFVDDPFVGFSPTPSPANTAFSFSQDFASSLVAPKTPVAAIFGENANLASAFNTSGIAPPPPTPSAKMSVVDQGEPVFRNTIFNFPTPPTLMDAIPKACVPSPVSSVDVLGVDLETLSMSSGSSPPTPVASPTNASAAQIPPRLPIFSRLSSGDSD